MARRSSKLSLFPIVDRLPISDQSEWKRNSHRSLQIGLKQFALSLTAVLVLSAGNLFAQTNVTRYTVDQFSGDLAGNIVAESTQNLVINVDPNAAPDYIEALRRYLNPSYIRNDDTPITGNGGGTNFSTSINKRGSGVWRLGGASSYSAGTNNQFIVEAGTLELKRDATLEILGNANAANRRFELRDNTILNARGVNSITAGTISIGNNVSFGFDATADTSSGALLTLNGATSTTNAANSGHLNMLGFKSQGNAGGGQTITLLTYTYTGTAPAQGSDPAYALPPIRGADLSAANATYNKNYDLQVRGVDWDTVVNNSGGRLKGEIGQTTDGLEGTGGTTSIVINNFYSQVGQVQWLAGTGTWDAHTQGNWTGSSANITGANTFLHGDSVLFTAANQGTVTVQAGGVQIANNEFRNDNGELIASYHGMHITGGSHTFQNDTGSDIGIDGSGRVYIENSDSTNPTLVTFKSANSYWGGTTIGNNSEVTLENSGALGTGIIDVAAQGKLIFDIAKSWDVFYNNITGSGEIIKEGSNDSHLYIQGSVGTGINTTIKVGTLENNIGGGVLTIHKGATYDTVQGHRTISGLQDGYEGSTTTTVRIVDMRGYDLTINTTSGSYTFSGLLKKGQREEDVASGGKVTKYTKLIKTGSQTQTFVYNPEIEYTDSSGNTNVYQGGTDVLEGTLVGEATLDNNGDKEIKFDVFGSGDLIPGTNIVGGDMYIAEGATLKYDIKHEDPPGTIPTNAARVNNRFYGGGDIVKIGDAILTLSGQSVDKDGQTAFSGNVLVQEGYLRLEHNDATGKAKKVGLSDNTVLQFTRSNPPGNEQQNMAGNSRNNPYDRFIDGKGRVEILENTKVYLKSNVPEELTPPAGYEGSTTVYAGANLVLLDPTATGQTSKIDLSDQTFDQTIVPGTFDPGVLTLDFDQILDEDGKEVDQVFDRYITGKGDLIKLGPGVAVLSHNSRYPENDYEGETFVNAGTLKLTYAGATGLPDDPEEQSVTVARGAYLELAFANDGETYNKGIKGEGSLAKSGDNLVRLGGYSTYTGGTYIYGGTLSFTDMISKDGNLGTGGVFFKRGGGTLQNTRAVDELGQNVLIDSSSTAIFDTQSNLTTSYDILHNQLASNDPYYDPANPNSNLVKVGRADMTINGSAQWTGTTTVKEGWLYNNVPETTDLYVYSGAGYNTGRGKAVNKTDWQGSPYERIVASIHGETDQAGGEIVVEGGTDLVVNYKDTTTSDIFAGSIKGDGGLVLYGNGGNSGGESQFTTLELTGNNSYRGATIVDGSYGKLIGNIAEKTDLILINFSNWYFSGGRNRNIGSLQGFGSVDMEGMSLTITQDDLSKNPIFYGNIKNGDDFTKQGQGSQSLLGSSYTFAGNVYINKGTLNIGNGSSPTYLNVGKDLILAPNTPDPVILDMNSKTQINVTGKADLQGTLNINASSSLIDAGSVNLGDDSVLNVTGIGENDVTMIIRSKQSIDTDFGKVTVAGAESVVDYLSLGVEKRNNNKEIWVGQTLRWYASQDAHGTFTLENIDGSYTVGRKLEDVSGTFDPKVWDGKTLTKKGPGTLILAQENTYTGQTIVEEGRLKLTHEKATGGSSEIILSAPGGRSGGTLELAFNSRNDDGTWSEGLTTPISGPGNVIKTGPGTVSVLSGNNSYTGRTEVQQGALLLDGSITSDVYVSQNAGFGGNGIAGSNVTFESGSYYYWRFGATESDSDMLTVNGKLLIGDNVFFRPYTSLMSEEQVVNAEGWTVIQYGDLFGKFAGVDSSTSPFYSFELDYDTYGVIKISGSKLDQPRALSDVMSMSSVMAQTKMYRTAFQQIKREWASDCPAALRQIRSNESLRGQDASTPYRTAWMNFVGRGDHFESSYHNDDYSLQSYGVQTGISLYSTCDRSFGLMFGREEAKLSNDFDKVENEDYYLGFYFARQFQRNFDFFGYVGGGWQKNDMIRRSNERMYGTDFKGNTFNFNFEIGKRFYNDRCTLFRPYFGFDVEIVRVGSAEEQTLDGLDSNEKRNYRRSDLNQVFFKVGFETMRSWRKIDLLGGINLNWNIADTTPETVIYYPFVDKSVTGYGSDLGRFNVGLNVGLNWYLTERRNAVFFIDYLGEIHQDRKNHFAYGTGTVGFSWRF